MFKKITLLITILTVFACKTTQPIATTKTYPKHTYPAKKTQPKTTAEVIQSTSKTVVNSDVIVNYVSDFKSVAMNNMKKYGIPASIILAQGILESGAGNGDLALNANNHFGIKCHNDWTGERVYHDDDASQECFRKYNDPAESYRDHALFLTNRDRYASLFSLPKDDYKSWAKGLRKAGYATDSSYPEKLISYIERYNLAQYDAQVLGVNSNEVIAKTNENSIYEVQKGDTLYSISKKFNLSVEALKELNNITENALSIGQNLKIE